MVDETNTAATKSRNSWRWNLYIPVVLIGTTIVCGGVGTYQYLSSLPAYQAIPNREVLLEALFTSLSFLVLNSGPYPVTDSATPLLVYLGRGTGVLFFSYAAVVGFGALFAERLKPLRITLWQLQSQLGIGNSDGHVIVCGVGHKGFELASELLASGHNVVAIERDSDSTRAAELSEQGALVLSEDATRRRTIGQRAKAHAATEIFVNCGRDVTNTRVVQTLANWFDDRPAAEDDTGDGYVNCRAHIADRRRRHFVHDQLHEHTGLRLYTYDSANATARELLHRRPVDRFASNSTTGRTHVVLLGWSPLSQALVYELCQTMYYLDEQDRQITVVCRNPTQARSELYDRHPSLDADHWERESVESFVQTLFPTISFLELPVNEDVLLSDQFELYDRLRPDDTLTLIAADEDAFQSGSPVATILPRLEAIDDELGLDTAINYFVPSAEDRPYRSSDSFRIESDEIDVRPFGEFVDNCTPATVRGEHRDRVAKRMALFFHLRYDFHPAAADPSPVDRALASELPTEPPDERGYSHETAVSLWEELTDEQVATLAEIVWEDLSETNRDSNRHAADHAPIKHRLEDGLGDQMERNVLIEHLSETEHRRWCAEKFLAGWEPLPEENAAQWRAEDTSEQRFRRQKYHLDLRPMDELERLTDGEAEKDVALVRFVLAQVDIENWN